MSLSYGRKLELKPETQRMHWSCNAILVQALNILHWEALFSLHCL
jgi:hypothetical protein